MDKQGRSSHPARANPESPGGHDSASDDDADMGDYSRNLSSASSALQGLLKKLGAGFDDILPAGFGLSSSRLKGILAALKSDDPTQQLDALSQLCELLSISTEEALTTFPVDEFVPLLVNLLNAEYSPDTMLFAARALTFLADVLPSSCNAIVGYNAVPAFCARLLNIEYIDLAEQSLQALGKISHEHPGACLRAGGMCAVLSFLDFFPTSMQHVAVVTAADMAYGAGPSSMEQVKDTVPILTNLLQHHDPKVVDNACLALSRLAEAISKNPANLESFCSKPLIEQVLQLVAINEDGTMTTSLSLSTYYGLLKLLATCASGLPMVAETLLEAGISSTIQRLLSSSVMCSSSLLSSASILRSADQLSLVLSLASSLLPSVPDACAVAVADPPVSVFDDSLSPRNSSKTDGDPVRVVFLASNSGIMQTLGSDLLDQLLKIYGGTVAPGVRQHCLGTITKLLHYSPSEVLEKVLQDLPISSFVAGLLSCQEPAVVANGLQIAEILLSKLPTTLSPYFLKEGAVHAIEQLAEQAPPASSAAAVAAAPRATRMRTRSVAARTRRPEEAEAEADPTAAAPLRSNSQPPPPAELRKAVTAWAARFKKSFFTDAGITSDNLDTPGLQAMRRACGALASREPGCISRLLQILESSSSSVSTFEFLTSGAVTALRKYLTGAGLNDVGEGRTAALLQQLGAFAKEALPNGSGEVPPLLALVEKLQECLAASEAFPMLLSNGGSSSAPGRERSGGGGSSLSSGLAALSQPFKLRLCRESGQRSVRDYSSNVVLIEPLATMRAIEDFLWQRVQLSDTGAPGGSSRDNASRSLRSSAPGASVTAPGGSSAGANGRRSLSKPVPIDDNKGDSERMTRSSAARASANAAASGAATAGRAGRGPGDDDIFQMSDQQRRDAAEERDSEDEEDEDMDDDEIEDPSGGFMLEEDEDYEDEDLDDLGINGLHVHDVSRTPEAASPGVGAPGTSAGRGPAPVGRRAGSGAATAGTGSESTPARGAAGGDAAEGGGAPAGAAPGGSVAAAAHKLVFKMNGKVLEPTTTIFQAILQGSTAAGSAEEGSATAAERVEGQPLCSQRLWEKVYTISYAPYSSDTSNAVAAAEGAAVGDGGGEADGNSHSVCSVSSEGTLQELVTQGPLKQLAASEATVDVLEVLRCIEVINRQRSRLLNYVDAGVPGAGCVAASYVPPQAFISRKLSPKLGQQLQDVLTICGGGLPGWCQTLVKEAAFLFPFETRRRYFYCTALGLARALQHLQNTQMLEGPAGSTGGGGGADGREMRLARLQRQKVRVNRPRILESAVKVFELYASHRAVLEVEYVGEVGTGLGPTLEFYTLLSHELQRKGLGMWRENNPSSQRKESHMGVDKESATSSGEPMIVAPHGLFPVPILDPSSAVRTIEKFRLLGRMMAKALQDSRLVDLPLSPCFYRAALGRALDLHDITSFDPQLGASLVKLRNGLRNRTTAGKVLIDGVCVEDLCLQFTVPGQEEAELKPGGRDISVTADNVEEYLTAVVDALLGRGISTQIEAFRSGFNEVFPLHHLSCFYEHELEILLCGSDDPWDVDLLLKSIKFDHGYSSDSAPIRHFVEALCDLDAAARRSFLRFVTGSPRLPPGGLSALQPQLTVVRKHPTGGDGFTPGTTPGTPGMRLEGTTLADNDLVSVMTCANYIKLPPYSCKEVLVDRLMFVIREGQCSFDLS